MAEDDLDTRTMQRLLDSLPEDTQRERERAAWEWRQRAEPVLENVVSLLGFVLNRWQDVGNYGTVDEARDRLQALLDATIPAESTPTHARQEPRHER